ncbi:MAG TPA: OmpA family protein [Anaeromyxobacteraceae bacterium]
MGTSYDDLMQEAHSMRRPSRLPWTLLVLALAAGSAASLVLLRKVQALRAETTSAGTKVREADIRLAAADATNADLQARLQVLEKDKRVLLAAQGELSSSVREKEDELARLKGTAQELEVKMKAEIARGEIRLSQASGRLQVDLVDKILFDSGDAKISKRGEEVLARVGSVLANVKDRQIQVAGHTDGAPISARLVARYPSNWELSASRATNVVRFLEEKAHVPPKRLVASGYGSFHPLVSNATPAGRARNRRIEILLTPALDPAPSSTAVARAEPANRGEALARVKPVTGKSPKKH